jgi:hypothetical protein
MQSRYTRTWWMLNSKDLDHRVDNKSKKGRHCSRIVGIILIMKHLIRSSCKCREWGVQCRHRRRGGHLKKERERGNKGKVLKSK